MIVIIPTAAVLGMLLLTGAAWWRYRSVARATRAEPGETCPFSLTDRFSDHHLVNAPHQRGVRWLPEVFSRSAARFPNHPAVEVPGRGERLTYAELDQAAERIATAVAGFLSGPDQVVAVAMPQDSSHIVAAHLGVLRAGGVMLFLDAAAPEPLIEHMLADADPVLVLTRGQASFRGLPTVDLNRLPEQAEPRQPPAWWDDPATRLAALFYTSGTTGRPKGVECPHAGYVNLAPCVSSGTTYLDQVLRADGSANEELIERTRPTARTFRLNLITGKTPVSTESPISFSESVQFTTRDQLATLKRPIVSGRRW